MSRRNDGDEGVRLDARYFFHIRNGAGEVRDEEGQWLVAGQSARQVAIEGARSVMAADVLDGFLFLDGAVDVCDAGGKHILTLSFRDAITMR